jgi:hypothetical protein
MSSRWIATSGQAFLYDAWGHLLFSGGITAARGHIGDNMGRRSVASLVSGKPSALTSTPVFGCPLIEDHKTARSAEPACQD